MCCAASARSIGELDGRCASRPRRRSPTATARWCASWSRPCCAASARCAICVGKFLERGFPADAPRVETALLIGAAQILFLDVPDHAAVDLSVRLVQADRRAARLSRPDQRGAAPGRAGRPGAARRARHRAARHAGLAVQRWRRNFGDETARAIAIAHGHEPPLDLTVKSDAESWAQRLRGRVLPTGTRAHDHAGPGRAAARLQRRRLVGAGRGRRACRPACSATFPANRSPTCAPRPAARPRSWRRPARASPRSTARPIASRACATTSPASACEAETGRRRRDRMAGRPVRRRAGRCAVLVHRHDPPPSRRRLAEAARPISRAHRTCSAACSTARSRSPSPAAASSIASARSSPRKASSRSRRCWRASRGCAAFRSRPGEIDGIAEFVNAAGDLRTLPSHWDAVICSDPRMGGLDGFFAARLERLTSALA